VTKFIKHADYTSERKQHDIAIVHLSEEVDFQKNIGTVCIPVFDYQNVKALNSTITKKFKIAGWGKSSATTQSSDVLQKTFVDFLENEDCITRFETASRTHKDLNINILHGQICAVGRNNSDA
jgi:ribosomal protein S18